MPQLEFENWDFNGMSHTHTNKHTTTTTREREKKKEKFSKQLKEQIKLGFTWHIFSKEKKCSILLKQLEVYELDYIDFIKIIMKLKSESILFLLLRAVFTHTLFLSYARKNAIDLYQFETSVNI